MLPLALFLALVTQPQDDNAMGYTRAQIFRMGEDKWLKLYAAKNGESTHAMIFAFQTWEEAQGAENDRLARIRGVKTQGMVNSLRHDMFEMCSQTSYVAYAVSGGGTMWGPINAAQAAAREDALYSVLTKKRSKKHFYVSNVTKLLDRLDTLLTQSKADVRPEFGSFDKIAGDLKAARTAYKAVCKTASKLPTDASDWILSVCFDAAKTGVEFSGDSSR